nr:ATP-binding protein [Thalassotalea sp. G2M2-11]
MKPKQYFSSLKSRLIISALLTVLVLLPIAGVTLFNAYQQHMRASIENELVAYSYSLLAVAEIDQGQLLMPEALAEERFNINESGLYALITTKAEPAQPLWRSSSLMALADPQPVRSPDIGQRAFYQVTLANAPHFIYSFSFSFTSEQQHYDMTLHIVKDQTDHMALMSNFKQQLWSALFILMAVLLLVQFIWLKWSLTPLRILKREVADVEKGKANELIADYPDELQQVKEQINLLLNTEQNQRKRYRNALSDLAHSLKTPLAVLQGQVNIDSNAESNKQAQEQIDVMNLMIEHQLKRAQSAGQSSWHLGTEISPVLDKLLASLQKIYRDKDLSYHSQLLTTQVFKGDQADLLEILGNLLDNASKAATAHVAITILVENNTLVMTVEDDGAGIDHGKMDEIMLRGTRADTYDKGHGVGLAIVRDLVSSYQGHIEIGHSAQYQGAQFTLTFPIT